MISLKHQGNPKVIVDITNVADRPLLLFALSFAMLCLSARFGRSFFRKRYASDEDTRKDFELVLGASLTLLGLIIGFSFSMAISRCDQRKNYEENEANAIGTEYLRADLVPASDGVNVRALLRKYLDQRIRFYLADDRREDQRINDTTVQLQTELWSTVAAPATAHPNPLVALAVSGMNDVLNSQGLTQAVWWNRIPTAAWALMAVFAIGCNLLLGMRTGPSLAEPSTDLAGKSVAALAVVMWGLFGCGICAGSSGEPEPATKSDTVDVAAASGNTTTGLATTEPLFNWHVAWQGWDGLSVDFSDRFRTAPELLGLTTAPEGGAAHTRFSLRLGGRLEVDGAAYDTSGDVERIS